MVLDHEWLFSLCFKSKILLIDGGLCRPIHLGFDSALLFLSLTCSASGATAQKGLPEWC